MILDVFTLRDQIGAFTLPVSIIIAGALVAWALRRPV